MRTNFFLETMRVAGRLKSLTAFGLLLAAMVALLFGMLTAKPAHADTFTVNTTDDTNDNFCDPLGADPLDSCSLREAIKLANARPGADTIAFNIPDDPNVPGNEVKTISIPKNNPLPTITDAVTIDGYSQPGTSPASADNDAVLLIELRSAEVRTNRSSWGLQIHAPNSVVRGLTINRFGYGMLIGDGATGNFIEGNYIGTDPSGTTAPADSKRRQYVGVNVADVSNVTIGGTSPAARNVISGNRDGIVVDDDCSDIQVLGNYIGTTKDGTGDLGNNEDGVLSIGQTTVVGGVAPGAANVIAFNKGTGVRLPYHSSTGNRILKNSIHSNGSLGIDLGGGGVTPNDPKDPDRGANNLQNFPELTSAVRNANGTVTISGKLNSTPGKTFTIQGFSSPEADPSGFGEGKTWLVDLSGLSTDDQGDAPFTIFFQPQPNQPASPGDRITATATDEETDDTSEFSNAVKMASSE
jgi:CSLREA domain-containing protein